MMEGHFLKERIKRIKQARNPNMDKALLSLETESIRKLGRVEDIFLNTLKLVKTIEYRHVGLSSEQYILHPIRVASLALEYVEEPTERLLRACLLHNVQEVGVMSEWLNQELIDIKDELDILTIDRSQSCNPRYLDKYYAGISSVDICRSVKVLDKLDNIYMICSNPDEQRRIRYLEEIRHYIVPLAEEIRSGMGAFIDELAGCAERLGHLESN